MRHPHPRNDAGGADATGSDADLHRVCPGPHQILGTQTSGHIAGDEISAGELAFQRHTRVDGMVGVTMGDVEHQHVNPRFHHGPGPDERIPVGAHCRPHGQALSLDLGNLRRLLIHGEEPMDHAHAPHPTQRHGHLPLTYRVHVGRHYRQIQAHIASDLGPEAHVGAAPHGRPGRNDEDIVERESEADIVEVHSGTPHLGHHRRPGVSRRSGR